MAKILKGKHKDKIVRIMQWSNDWISIDGEGITNRDSIMNPTSLQYDEKEFQLLNMTENVGMFWDNFQWKAGADPFRLEKI